MRGDSIDKCQMLHAFRQPIGTRRHAECPTNCRVLGLAMGVADQESEMAVCREGSCDSWQLAIDRCSTNLRRLVLECSTTLCFISVGTFFVV